MSSPKKNVAYEFSISLVDSGAAGSFKANPTIAAGDFKVSTDNGAFANLTTLPVVDPAGSIIVKINLSQSEMNGDKILVQCIDAAGAEWSDVLIFIDATTANVDDIVRSTTPANTLDINATGEVGSDVIMISGDAAAADNLEAMYDGAGYTGAGAPSSREQVDAIPTTAMRGTDNAGTATNLATVDTVVDAIKAKTDKLTFTSGNNVDSNIQKVNDVTVTGTGASGDEWGP